MTNKREEAFLKLKEYNGNNPYLLLLKKDVYVNKKYDVIQDFQTEYILKNYDFEPIKVNKITNIVDWFGEKKKNDWNTDFTPQKLRIIALLGETETTYHCYVQYRQSVQPIQCFIPKKAVLNNFLVDDYRNTIVDFNRYNKLSTAKDPNRKIKEHQQDGIKFLLSRKKCILADDMGFGKTLELSVAAIEGNFDSILIICPASLKTNWKKELMWYVPEKDISIVDSFNNKNKGELEVFLGYGDGKSNKNRDELLEEAKNEGKWQDNRFVIVNFDVIDEFYEFPKTRSKENIEKALQNSPILKYITNKKSLIIIDEAHKLSNNTSIRYKVIKDLIKRGNPDSIYLATGTPITNNPQNLFCLLQFLDDPIKDDWKYFADRYCDASQFYAKGERERWTGYFLNMVKKSSWYDLTPVEKDKLKDYLSRHARKITVAKGASNLDELKQRISHIYLRRVKEDLEGMVKKTIHELHYGLSMVQKTKYDKLWDEYEEEQKNIDPNKELNKELIEGSIYRRYLSVEMVPNTIKLCDEFLENGEKVVISCCFDEELYKLKEYYGDKCVIYNGKMNIKQKDEAVNKFQNDENIKVFIGNVIAAGVGLTLTSSHKLIFNHISYVPSDSQQMMDRICRIGQTNDCDIYFQIYDDTQYENMWNIVVKKSFIIDSVIKKESEK